MRLSLPFVLGIDELVDDYPIQRIAVPAQVVEGSSADPLETASRADGSGTHIAVPEDEPAEQSGLGAIAGIVEAAIAVDEEEASSSWWTLAYVVFPAPPGPTR